LETDILRRTAELVEIALRLPAGERERFIQEKAGSSPSLFHAAMTQLRRASDPQATMAAGSTAPDATLLPDATLSPDATISPDATLPSPSALRNRPGPPDASSTSTVLMPSSPSGGMRDLMGTATSGLRHADETHPSADPAAWVSPRTQPGELDPASIGSGVQIGNLVVEKLLAQGGMGAVYLASQVEEGFRRQVAVKVVKPELATVGVMQRFFQERQVLASLDHPNVARLLDAGTTREGTPFLVMEFVEGGEKIDEYCESRQLDTLQRIRLFLTVCDAVQYAHQRLVVHRDIKPSNILVTKDGVPKLLDFGIAKMMTPDQDETAIASGLTTGGEAPMTPMYASPEQVRGETVTTSTDIYSLAILLYEVLTGCLPYEFKQMTAAGVERTICESEPVPPSRAEIKRKLGPGESVPRLRKQLDGELDVILLMALRKEADRRYLTVYQFADDLKRHLNGEPVLAHKDTFKYRMGKFVRRHKGGVAAAALALVSLIASSIVSTYFARQAQEEKVVAVRRFRETRELARYVVTDLDDAIRRGETAARRELVEKGLVYLKRLSEEAAGDLSLQKEVLRGYVKMGDILGNPFGPNLGQASRARATYETALSAGERFGGSQKSGPLHGEMALVRRKLADLDAVSGRSREAFEAYSSVVDEFRDLELADVRYQMGWVRFQQGKYDEALQSYQVAMETAGAYMATHPDSRAAQDVLARAAERVGETLWYKGDVPGAETNLRAALKSHEQRVLEEPESGGVKRRVWSASMLLGGVLEDAGKIAEAEGAYRRALAISDQQRKLDPANRQHRTDQFTTLGRLAGLLEKQPSRRREAHALTARTISELKPLVESGNAAKMDIDQFLWLVLSTPFQDLQDPKAALPLLEKDVERTGGQDARVLDMLARALFGTGQVEKAIETEKRALGLLNKERSPIRQELETNLATFERGLAAGRR
jgi:non-specific serine/threonine protein kinase/serine/threonine-protein kinase